MQSSRPLSPPHYLTSEGMGSYIGAWNCHAGLYGTAEQVSAYLNIIKNAFAKVDGARVYSDKELGDDPWFQFRIRQMKGEVKSDLFWKDRYDIFSPIVPNEGKHVLKMVDMADQLYEEYGFSTAEHLIFVHTRSAHAAMPILIEKEGDRQRSADLYMALLKKFGENGCGPYRTSIAFMDAVGQTYGSDLQAVFRKIKRELDPNGILSPGKSGIDIQA